jgi:hypothetical protein
MSSDHCDAADRLEPAEDAEFSRRSSDADSMVLRLLLRDGCREVTVDEDPLLPPPPSPPPPPPPLPAWW